MIKAMCSQLKNSLVILLPVRLIQEVDGPQLLNLLLEQKNQRYGSLFMDEDGEMLENKSTSSPIVLVVEDGDQILLPRNDNSASTISTLLNQTDGILGNMMDIRIIVSTNIDHLEIEGALKRPGRLLSHILINDVSAERAASIYKRLTSGKEKKYTKPTTLAYIYRDAIGKDFVESQLKENEALGFKI
jgi:SpoVK/Ycf46/Vps4 family AAA+-type ATPase